MCTGGGNVHLKGAKFGNPKQKHVLYHAGLREHNSERETKHFRFSSAKVKNYWRHTSTPLHAFMACTAHVHKHTRAWVKETDFHLVFMKYRNT
jgi:hypothetical protein